ncbi:uncharacterized protein DUF4302 [Chitinophaga skermanii]|uniref:Uncharacterized protein DUF4302 n=1 Tax=Chitinophaga skermanii TaxID=331697 RepID=A0A327QW53_9BACT|nr:DUF4302 domain-containing protein [Chitinophaga skermanii]RAJ08581.1 uncharacterized protein DUF4302 [Chitinophaga skermanii]
MKNILIPGLLLAIISITACRKIDSDPVFGQRPDERLMEILEKADQQLKSSEFGYQAYLFPSEGGNGGFAFYVKFDPNNRVQMYSDINASTSSQVGSSSYRLKAIQTPSLFFDTYNYMHVLSDPDNPLGIGGRAVGNYGDFEFSIDSTKGDTIHLTGNKQKSPFVLVKASQADANFYKNNGLYRLDSTLRDYMTNATFLYVEDAKSGNYAFSLNADTRVVSLSRVEGGEVVSLNTEYALAPYGLYLNKAITIGGVSYRYIYWDAATKSLYFKNGDTRINIKNGTTAIIPFWRYIGVDFNSLVINDSPMDGWSTDFTTKWNAARVAMLNGPYTLRMGYLFLTFNKDVKLMTINLFIYQGANQFLATYPYSYTVTEDGVFKFKKAGDPNGNGGLIAANMAPLLNHIENDRFTTDYFIHPVEGVMGMMKSVENPAFSFSTYTTNF